MDKFDKMFLKQLLIMVPLGFLLTAALYFLIFLGVKSVLTPAWEELKPYLKKHIKIEVSVLCTDIEYEETCQETAYVMADMKGTRHGV